MKKLLFALLAVLALVSCSNPANEPAPVSVSEKPVAYVYNSPWENISLERLALMAASKGINAKAIAKDESDVTLAEVQAAVATYNAATTDDQLTIETEETSVEESPNVNAYIILSTTHEIVETYLDIPRTEFATNYLGWEMQREQDSATYGVECVLYIDNTPPEEIEYIPPAPKLWVALLDTTARKVYYSEHFDTEAEAQYRYSHGLLPQADNYNYNDIDDGIDVPGDVWQAYIGETEFIYSEE